MLDLGTWVQTQGQTVASFTKPLADHGFTDFLVVLFSNGWTQFQEGGELYFSDMYVDKILPPELKSHKILYSKFFIPNMSPS